MPEKGGSFWTTIPGILTALGGLVAAVAGLITALSAAGVIGGADSPADPVAVVAPADTASVPSTQESGGGRPGPTGPDPPDEVDDTPAEEPAEPDPPVDDPTPPEPGVPFDEDCLGFDPARLTVRQEGSAWLLTDGSSRMMAFPSASEARQAVRAIRAYDLDSRCFVGRPDPSFEYWRADGQSPEGALRGEDCLAFDPASLSVRPDGAGWLLTSGRSRMKTFPNQAEAERALQVIGAYGFTQTCYVGRPDPSLTYLRR